MCTHHEIELTVQVVSYLRAVIADTNQGGVVVQHPIEISVGAYCADCGFSSQYNAYWGKHPQAGARWPKWLRRRMTVLAAIDPLVHAAMERCEVPSVGPAEPPA